MDFSKLPITLQMTIPEEYIDIFGHVNVMYYTHMFDEATYVFFDLFGFGETYYRTTNNGSFAAESHTRFLAEVRAGQGITIYSRLLGYGKKTVHFMNFMVRDHDGALAATTELLGINIDMQARRSALFSPEISAQLETMLTAHTQLDWDAPVCGAMGPR